MKGPSELFGEHSFAELLRQVLFWEMAVYDEAYSVHLSLVFSSAIPLQVCFSAHISSISLFMSALVT